ncbi:MAG TPA: NAD(P)H-dependent oxidoreductase, partial [Saprospiraceae bacterium]|nr:NAD(P)H-dependent oxidoreductase [Saprospiraceae bacterium]
MDINTNREPISFLVFSASLRKDSLNTRLAKIATSLIEKNGGKVDYATMSEFDCASFNQDLEMEGKQPDGA